MPQLDIYILSSQILFLFFFFLLYFFFNQNILSIASFLNKIKDKILFFFKFNKIINYILYNYILNINYKNYKIINNFINSYIYYFNNINIIEFNVYYSILRLPIIFSFKLSNLY